MAPSHSLWLTPEPGSDAHEHLADRIASYAADNDDAPVFDPHLTVVGGADVDAGTAVDLTRGAVADHDPFAVRLVRPYCSTTRYQCVFLLAAPTAELLALRRDAQDAFGRDPAMYTPHLSLLYSDVGLAERRAMVESYDGSELPVTFTAADVAVVETGADVAEWSVVERVPL